MAIERIVESEVVEWVDFSGSLRPGLDADTEHLCEHAAGEAYRAFKRSASRVADDRKEAFASVDESALAAAVQLTRTLLIEPDGDFDAVAALDGVS